MAFRCKSCTLVKVIISSLLFFGQVQASVCYSKDVTVKTGTKLRVFSDVQFNCIEAEYFPDERSECCAPGQVKKLEQGAQCEDPCHFRNFQAVNLNDEGSVNRVPIFQHIYTQQKSGGQCSFTEYLSDEDLYRQRVSPVNDNAGEILGLRTEDQFEDLDGGYGFIYKPENLDVSSDDGNSIEYAQIVQKPGINGN